MRAWLCTNDYRGVLEGVLVMAISAEKRNERITSATHAHI
jgi:hypothetical protein